MKQIVFLFATLLFLLETTQAQDSLHNTPTRPSVKISKDRSSQKYSGIDYAVKSSKSRTAGWVLLSVGIVFGVTGLIVYENQLHSDYDLYHIGQFVLNTTGAEVLMFSGASMVLISIPVFISAGQYKRKALKMSAAVKFEPSHEIYKAGISLNHFPALGLNIRF